MSATAGQDVMQRDGELVRRLLLSDESVLSEILAARGGGVWRRLNLEFDGALGAADLEDVLSVALYRLWASRHSFDAAKASLGTWFFAIARNAALDVLKHGWHKARALEVPVDFAMPARPAVELDGEGYLPGTPASEAETIQDLRSVLSELPLVQRQILEADAQTWPEVAASEPLARELGLSPRSIPVYRKRAMEAVRAGLAHCAASRAGVK